MNQFTNLSSWREDNIVVKSGECYQLSFIDTKPNMFYVQNPNNCKLKISISKIPTKTNYEFLVNPNTSEPLGRPIPTGNLYILNTGTVDANLKIYSIADKFDMNILKNFTVQLDGVQIESSEEISFKEGVSLPSGNNNIGIVSPDSETAGNIETIVEKTSATAQVVSSNMLEIKNNVVGCADNSRDILWQLDGRTEVTGEKRHLVKEIADGINQINSEGIGAQLNGDVILDPSVFWKKEIEENNATISKTFNTNQELLKNKYSLIDGLYDYYINISDIPSIIVKAVYESDENTTYYIKFTTSIKDKYLYITSYALTSPTDPISNAVSSSLHSMKLINETDEKTTIYYTVFCAMNVKLGSPKTLKLYKPVTAIKNITFYNNIFSGILYDMNRIKDYIHSGTYKVNSKEMKDINEEFYSQGQKMWDKIEMICATSDDLKVGIFFTPDTYLVIGNLKTCPIKNLNIPVYLIRLNNIGEGTQEVTLIGGKF